MDDKKISKILKELTITEKAKLLSGLDNWHTKPIERLGIPSASMADGPHGLRKEKEDDDNMVMKSTFPATCFPTASCSACSWNPDLLYEMGVAIAEECKEHKVGTILGPGINIKRSPLCGRNFEYFSEDPNLAAQLGIKFIQGVQSQGIGTSLKHFAANNQEYLRMSISAVIDERALHEIYLRAFEDIVKAAQPTTIMCSYNRINGVYSSDNKMLLTDVLRDKWGYQGLVVSDWGATNDRVLGVKAGLDLEMPYFGTYHDNSIVKAVNNKDLREEDLDRCVTRVLKFAFQSAEAVKEDYEADYTAHHKLARRIAGESIVLMKNDENILPLKKTDEVLVIGELANNLRYQGSGSSRINPYNLANFLKYLEDSKIRYTFTKGYSLDGNGYDQKLIDEAINLASKKDKIIIFAGLTDAYESEGYDRANFAMPDGQNALIDSLSKISKNIIVVMLGGAPYLLPWLDKVKSIINAYLPGEAGGEAIGDIVFGDVNPSGKLAETWPYNNNDNLADRYFKDGPTTVEYRESIYVGYRFYDTNKMNVAFPFGHGLSYTSFVYSNLKITPDKAKQGQPITISLDVRNSGKVDGAEVVQLYVKDKEFTIFRPDKELAAFKKVFIKANQSIKVEFTLTDRAFSYYNINIDDWHIESGDFEILIGASSRDIKLTGIVNITSANPEVKIPDFRDTAKNYYTLEGSYDMPATQFEAVYGKVLPKNLIPRKGNFSISSTIIDIKDTFIGRIIQKIIPAIIKSQIPTIDQTTLLAMQAGLNEIPIRSLVSMTSGIISYNMAMGIVNMANGKFFKGFGKVIGGAFSALFALHRIKKAAKKKEKSK